MYLDARQVPRSSVVETEICIIGAGAAGITIAREFIDNKNRVCLVESGGFIADGGSQDLYAGSNVGLPYPPLEATRLRFFGGSTNHWEGNSRPLDDIDFEYRDWVPYSGWPIKKKELLSYYHEAQKICELGAFEYGAAYWEKKYQDSNIRPDLFTKSKLETKMFQWGPPTRFGQEYRDELKRAANVSVYLHANATEIVTTDNARVVTEIKIKSLDGNEFIIKAKKFVLALGGIENPRLLLASNRTQKTGLGNQNDLVGRFFMEHPHPVSGVILPASPDISWMLYTKGRSTTKPKNWGVYGHISLSGEEQRRKKLLNWGAVLREDSFAGFRDEVDISMNALSSHDDSDSEFSEHINELLRTAGDLATQSYEKFFKARKPIRLIKVIQGMEQAPNPDSRVLLSTEKDALGLNRSKLDWRLLDIDKETVIQAQMILAAEVGRLGLGRLKVDIQDINKTWPEELAVARHHMGTTRMSSDPKYGVVDAECRVHGISNLFIAGSSVFPTGGFTTPTLTIVALSLRLAERLKKQTG